jgi:hypothetical protein
MPHSIIRGLALGSMLFLLIAIVWAVNGEPNVAASFAGPMMGLLVMIDLIIAVAIIEYIHRDKNHDKD